MCVLRNKTGVCKQVGDLLGGSVENAMISHTVLFPFIYEPPGPCGDL